MKIMCIGKVAGKLIEGFPYAMSLQAGSNHQRIANNLAAEFTFQLKKCRKYNVYDPVDYIIENDTILQPDILIVCDKIKKKFFDFPPALVVEILSPSTALKDRHTKYDIYQSQGIKYYLIISPETEEVEVYELTGDNGKRYELKQKGHAFHFNFSFNKCKASIDFKEIW